MKFIGRTAEIKELDRCLHSNRSHFVAVYGRRRVGKTFLVKSFFKNTFAFYTTGLADANKKTQLQNFNLALKKYHNKDDELWLNMLNTPEYFAWAGNAFEIVCLQHAQEIKNGLGISGIQSKIYAWANASSQIDMVIDRKDQVINLIEAKFSIDEFTITKSYAENLRKKISEFRAETQTKKSVWLVTVSVFGLASSPYNDLVQKDLTMDIFFK